MKKPNKDFPAGMVKLAARMRAKAYAPYSGYTVGAVVRAANGKLYGGCNVENAAYPVGTCAEAGATAALVAAGETEIVEVLVMGGLNGKGRKGAKAGKAEPCTPCGACRQRLREFVPPEKLARIAVHCTNPQGKGLTTTLDVLLPFSFGPDHVKR
jgi:cytidine deaminase